MSKRLTIEEFIKTLGKGGGGNLVLRATSSEPYTPPDAEAGKTYIRIVFNHTWQEVYDAVAAGAVVILDGSNSGLHSSIMPTVSVIELPTEEGEGGFAVMLEDVQGVTTQYTVDSKDQYLAQIVENIFNGGGGHV